MTSNQIGKHQEEEKQGWHLIAERFSESREKSIRMISLRAGDTLVRMQDTADKVYLLLSGTVTVQNEHANGTVYAFATFPAPSLFGEFEAFAGSMYYRGTLICQTDCRFAAMNREDYLAWMRSDAESLFFRMRDITQKLTHQARNERRFLFLSGPQRLAAFLCDAYARLQKDGMATLALTHQQLADEVGVSVKTVQRALKALKEQALVTVHGRKLILDDNQYAHLQKLSVPLQNDPDSEE
jgi:CRP/FNR family cyclic AMP-dependent transcriptional regulator